MRDLSIIVAQLRAVREAREHFMALWALECAYDLPVGAEPVRQDLRRLTNLGNFQSSISARHPSQDD